MIRAASIPCALVAGLALVLPSPTATAAIDWKAVHGSNCVPGAGTSEAELTYGAYGVANPGATDELVICPLPIDAEASWSKLVASTIEVRFRTGSLPGRVACSVYSGSAGAQDAPITTMSLTSATLPAATNSTLLLTIPDPDFSATPPVPSIAVACLLGPQVKLGGLFLAERVATHTP
jgi:hypothetical protein